MDQGKAQFPLLSTEQVIKPGQVPNLGFFTPQQRAAAQQKVTELWDKLNRLPPDDPEHHNAHKTLSDMSHHFKQRLNQYKQQQQQQQQQQAAMSAQMDGNAARTQMSQAQIAAQMQQQQQQQQQNAGQGIPTYQQPIQQGGQRPGITQQFSERVRQEAQKFNPSIPPEMRQRPPEEQRRWVNSQKVAYATYIQRWEVASHQFDAFRKRAAEARASMTPDDLEKAKAEMARLRAQLDSTQKQAMAFKYSMDPAAAAAAEHQRAQATRAAQAQQAAAAAAASQQVGGALKPEDKVDGQTHIKTEENDGDGNKARPGTASQDNQGQQTAQNSQTPVRPPTTSAQTAPPQSPAHPGKVTPLSLSSAIANAQKSRGQGTTPQHAHHVPTPSQSISRDTATPPSSSSAMNTNTGNNLPTNRPLNVAPLTPSAIPTSRPTLTGGQGPAGQQGQVALPKMPNVSLPVEHEGRVLSRNKLLELVREVTGGAVDDGSDALDPDVEEILLDVADEFVDNVTTAACQLAKIRGSTTLELRDVQLIMERNYNIRVPGFASDELRTVKRIVPTPAWTQKMSAVQAAKVTGGKPDA